MVSYGFTLNVDESIKRIEHGYRMLENIMVRSMIDIYDFFVPNFGKYFLFTVFLVLSACSNVNFPKIEGIETTDPLQYDPNRDGITKLFGDIQKHIKSDNIKEASRLIESLILTKKSDIESVLNVDHPGKNRLIDCVLNNQKIWYKTKNLTIWFKTKPDRTQTNVHGATTEEIAKNEAGSTAYEEFPAGIVPLASGGVLKPKTTFYEIEKVRPGEDLGLKWHLFAHTPSGWKIFGPIWLAFIKDESESYCGS